MEIPILDSILHDSLKPWLIDTSNLRQYNAIIKTVNQIKGDTYDKLHEQVNSLLVDYKHLSKKINKPYSKQQSKLVSNFYTIENPVYTDTITQFYYLIISKETERVFNSFIIESTNWTNPIDIHYHTTQTLLGIKVLASKVDEELIERNYTDNNPQDHIHYTLLILKNKLIALFFDIQEIFKEQLETIEDISSFTITYFGKLDASIVLIPSEALINHKLNKIINKEYNENELIDLLELSKTITSENINQLVASVENFIFCKRNNRNVEQITNLLDETTIKEVIENYQSNILENVNKHNLGHQRLMIINAEMESLNNGLSPSSKTNKFSIISKINTWLQQQKEIYQQNANAIFSNVETAKQKAGKLKSPLPKKDKANLDEQKSYATEHLAFLSGHNIKNEKIMTDTQYKQLLNYTYYLIEKETLPPNIKPIPQIGFASNGIRYTFYKIHEYLYGTQSIKQTWIDFIHEVFSQFKNAAKTTTKAKFSEKPNSYEADLKLMKK
jgi:hypothetical protein